MQKQKPQSSLIKQVLESDNESFYKEDCEDCSARKSVIKVKDYTLVSKDGETTVDVPAWICLECGDVSIGDEGMALMLNVVEQKEGNLYTRVKVKNGKITKFNIH